MASRRSELGGKRGKVKRQYAAARPDPCNRCGNVLGRSRAAARVLRAEMDHGPPGADRTGRVSAADQNAASSTSISELSVASAIARSAEILGRFCWAKNCAAATLPS